MQINTADWIIIVFYLALIAAIGIVAGLKIKDTDDYFLGKRRFGKLLMMGQSFGIGTHAEMPVSLAGAVYVSGISGIWYQWKNLFATPFYWIMAPVFRRVRRTTIGEVIEDRYGPPMAAIYTVFAVVFFAINIASMMKGAAKVISQATGAGVGANEIVVAMALIFIGYSFVGGLVASAWTDLFQGFLIIALSWMLIPLGWSAAGGMEGMREALPAFKFSLATPKGVGVWFLAMLTLNGLIGIMAQPHVLAAVGTGKNEHACRVGFLYGTFIKRFCTIGWALVGLIVAAVVARGAFGVSELQDPEDAFGFACRHMLFPGGIGLLIASVLAANMSTCSALMVDSGALLTQGLYRRLFPGRRDRHYLWVGRVSGFLITGLGVLYSLFLVDKVLHSFLLTETIATFVGISVVGGIMWRRANRWGALASLAAALGSNFLLYYWRGERLDHWDPDVFFYAMLIGTAALIGVSLATPPEPARNLESFVGRLQTPSDSDIADAQKLGSKPSLEAAAQGKQLLLPNLLQLRRAAYGLGIVRAYRSDLVGFAAGWVIVAAMVASIWLLLHL